MMPTAGLCRPRGAGPCDASRGGPIGRHKVRGNDSLVSRQQDVYAEDVEAQIEAFIEKWMRGNRHVLEEIVLMQGDDPSTPLGAAVATYLDRAALGRRFGVTPDE